MSKRARRSNALSPGGLRGAVAVSALIASLVRPEVALAAGADEEQKRAVERARSCVLKVECVDGAGTAAPTVLSAVSLDDDGYVVTVGLRAAKNRIISVQDCAGKRHQAQWVAADDHTGLALLKLQPGVTRPAPIMSSLPEVGSTVFVVGNPFGLSHSVSMGVVSGLDRTVSFSGGVGRGLIQFTAPVFPGDGGGLLADDDGRMLGIVSTALNEPLSDDSAVRRINGIGFAIPAAELRRIVQRLRDGQRVERGYLGLTAEDVQQGGVRVVSVLPDSPAHQAGLKEGDVIEAMDDRPVRDFDDLAGRIERLRPGAEVILSGKRGEDSFSVQAVLGERPAASRRMQLPPWPPRDDVSPTIPRGFGEFEPRRTAPWFDVGGAMLGVHTQPLTESLAKSLGLPNSEGVLVSSVLPGSPAERAGLRASDVIVSLNDEPVRSPQQLHERIRKLDPATTIRLDLVRDGNFENVEVTLAHPAPGAGEPMRGPGVTPWAGDPQRGRLEALEQRVKALEARLDELQKRLDARSPAPAPSRDN